MTPYTDLNTYLKQRFGKKVYKLSLDAGFTCPNRDGTLGTRGCIFCSAGGSGEFAARIPANILPEAPALSAFQTTMEAAPLETSSPVPVFSPAAAQVSKATTATAGCITDQLEAAKKRIEKKLPKNTPVGYIAYFQAFTNTYAPVERLRALFSEAIRQPDIVALSIATRPDCLGADVLQLLTELNSIKPVFVELGLQTIHEKTAAFIRRGYPYSVFTSAVELLHTAGIDCIVHLILGLPYETVPQMLETVRTVCALPIQGIKLQLLHILKGTDLADLYTSMSEPERAQAFSMLDRNRYLKTVAACLAVIPESIVIHRLTGDGDKRLLIAPLWSGDKKAVLNDLHRLCGANQKPDSAAVPD